MTTTRSRSDAPDARNSSTRGVGSGRNSRLGRVGAAVVASAALAGAGLAGWMVPEVVGAAGGGPTVKTVVLTVRHSRFLPDRVAVARGATVRFVVSNDDPIDHEFIVGPEAVHLRHESGTEASHGAVPGEVSLPAGEAAETTYTFAGPGPVAFACHLPGHLAFGMRGQVEVR